MFLSTFYVSGQRIRPRVDKFTQELYAIICRGVLHTPILLKEGVWQYAPTRILQKMTLTKYLFIFLHFL